MLHILWLILKITGIILLIVVGLLIFAVLSILLIPVRYTIEVKYFAGRPDIRVRMSWLLKLVRARLVYTETLDAKIKLLFFTVYDAGRDQTRKHKKRRSAKGKKAVRTVFDEEELETPPNPAPAGDLKITEVPGGKEAAQKGTGPGTEKEQEKAAARPAGPFFKRIWGAVLRELHALAAFFKKCWLAFTGFFKSLRQTGAQFQERAAALWAQINDPDNSALIHFLWTQIGQISRELKPRRHQIYIRFGTGDLETTARIAMYAALLYGLLGIEMQVVPDFERTVLEGTVFLKGRVRMIRLLLTVLRVYRNPLVRKKIRNKQ